MGLLASLVLGMPVASVCPQQFVSGQVPPEEPMGPYSENVDFADVDLDGDFDAAIAGGGEIAAGGGPPVQNRFWRNRGPGNLGSFIDQTAVAFPVIVDASRDVEFVDFDGDGDADIFVANEREGSRWWRNTGVGSGVYVDETTTRWVNLGVNNASSFSSIDPTLVVATGGFFDYCNDGDFADLDNDGDLDLVHSSLRGGEGVPTRIFLNDGAGFFEEFNPSQFQLTGLGMVDGDPGLWCSGLQADETADATGAECDVVTGAVDVDLGDIDGDFDIDILLGSLCQEPRMFENRTADNGMPIGNGVLELRDVTGVTFPADYAPGNGHYEQEMGDLDNDGDLDIFGLNWRQTSFNFNDVTLTNDGSGVFGDYTILPASSPDDEEADFIDYDLDGDMDLIVGNFSGQNRLYRNDLTVSGFSFVNATSGNVPSGNGLSRDIEVADLDNDGDYDVMDVHFQNEPTSYYINTENPLSGSDGHAPRLPNLEQASNRSVGSDPTVVRVQVYDNAPYYAVWYYDVSLRVSVDGGSPFLIPMRSSGGQIFRGEISGALVGDICYEVIATDPYGNSAASLELCYSATDIDRPLAYCVPKPSSAACMAQIGGSSNSAPASGDSDYSITAVAVQGFKNGLLFAGISGPAALPFNGGTLCVQPPTKRGPLMNSGGTGINNCDGSFSTLVNDGVVIPFGLDAGSGNSGWYQYWYRDPGNGAGNLGTALSDGIQVNFQ